MLSRAREAVEKQAFGLGRGHRKRERAERTDLRDQYVDPREEAREPMRLRVVATELLLVLAAAQVEDDPLLLRARHHFQDLVPLLAPRHLRHSGNRLRHGMTVGADR